MAIYCERCGNELSGRQQRWCSKNCSKLGLKSLSKKRNRERINAYNRSYRNKLNRRPLNKDRKTKILAERGNACENCRETEGLEIHHIRPLAVRGTHESRNLLVLCKKCHVKWEKRMKNYWY